MDGDNIVALDRHRRDDDKAFAEQWPQFKERAVEILGLLSQMSKSLDRLEEAGCLPRDHATNGSMHGFFGDHLEALAARISEICE